MKDYQIQNKADAVLQKINEIQSIKIAKCIQRHLYDQSDFVSCAVKIMGKFEGAEAKILPYFYHALAKVNFCAKSGNGGQKCIDDCLDALSRKMEKVLMEYQRIDIE